MIVDSKSYFERISLAAIQKTDYMDQTLRQENNLWEMIAAIEVGRSDEILYLFQQYS